MGSLFKICKMLHRLNVTSVTVGSVLYGCMILGEMLDFRLQLTVLTGKMQFIAQAPFACLRVCL